MTKIFSIRFSPAQGNHAVEERKCEAGTEQAWLSIYRADEPNVCFVACNKKPKV